MRDALLYVLRFPNGKAYVGMTTTTGKARLSGHLASAKAGSRLAVHAAIRKYGVPIFFGLQRGSIEEIAQAEQELIQTLNTLAPNGYNLDKGGLHRNKTEAERQHMREVWNRPGHREKVGQKISQSMQGRPMSEEHRRALSKAAKRRWARGVPDSHKQAGKRSAQKRWGI